MFPSSAECSNRSTTFIALPRNSSSFLLEPSPRPSLPNPEDMRRKVWWCTLRMIRTMLPIGPCPCKFGRKEASSDFEFRLVPVEGSYVCDGGWAVNVVNVDIACLYARTATHVKVNSHIPQRFATDNLPSAAWSISCCDVVVPCQREM